jgi:peptide/nickel transport system ATP-binding protein
MSEAAALVEVKGLTVEFVCGSRPVRAVSGVDFVLGKGEALVLLGESGSGKTMTLRALMRLLPNGARVGGSIHVDGREVLALSTRELANLRGSVVSMIFQEPSVALDPVYRIGDQIAETITKHEAISYSDARARALELFERVRIPSAKIRLDSYPHEMSGGMRQRAMIALALSCRPKVLLADEPTTALDATVQIQILLLLRELQRELGLAVIFVTHDIGVGVEIADRFAVMYAGRIVETASCRDIIRGAQHPYTQALLNSRAGSALPKGSRFDSIPGSPPDLADLPPGCAFAPRCRLSLVACTVGVPPPVFIKPDHLAHCVRLLSGKPQDGLQ